MVDQMDLNLNMLPQVDRGLMGASDQLINEYINYINKEDNLDKDYVYPSTEGGVF